MKFVTLSSLDTVNLVLFPGGLGGAFITSCLNLADHKFDETQLHNDHYTRLTKTPFPFEVEEPSIVGGPKALFMGLFLDYNESNLLLFLADLETRLSWNLVKSTRNQASDSVLQYYMHHQTTFPGKTIYLPSHIPTKHNLPYVEIASRIQLDAKKLGININFIVLTTTNKSIIEWTRIRKERLNKTNITNDSIMQDFMMHNDCLRIPGAIPFNMDNLFAGRFNEVIHDDIGNVVGQVSNLDTLTRKLIEFYKIKILTGMELLT